MGCDSFLFVLDVVGASLVGAVVLRFVSRLMLRFAPRFWTAFAAVLATLVATRAADFLARLLTGGPVRFVMLVSNRSYLLLVPMCVESILGGNAATLDIPPGVGTILLILGSSLASAAIYGTLIKDAEDVRIGLRSGFKLWAASQIFWLVLLGAQLALLSVGSRFLFR